MSRRFASWVAWPLSALSIVGVAVGLVLLITVPDAVPRSERFDALDPGFAAALLAFVLVGALIVSRRPRHLVGWLLFAIGVAASVSIGLQPYALHGLFGSSSLPGDEAAAWLTTWSDAVSLALVAPMLLLFPDGRLPARGWRPVGWLAAAMVAGKVMTTAFAPGELSAVPDADNPLGIESLRGPFEATEPFVDLLTVAVFIAAAAVLVARYRRARSLERLQLKWFSYAASLLAVAVLAITAFELAEVPEAGLPELAISILAMVALASVPVSTGIAILRYRLYDIDVVINRTLVYGALTATLALAYLSSVLLLQFALSPLGESGLAVAGSTLAVAALFRPARARIQGLVDRRFYRRKYDAAKTLEAFSARLRDEVDLDHLSADLRAVVNDTMQPAHVSLWLRRGTRDDGATPQTIPL